MHLFFPVGGSILKDSTICKKQQKYNYNVEYHQVWVNTAYDQSEYLSTIIAIRYSEFHYA